MISASLFSGLIGSSIPGSVYLDQHVKYVLSLSRPLFVTLTHMLTKMHSLPLPLTKNVGLCLSSQQAALTLFRFVAPVFVGEEVKAEVVLESFDNPARAKFSTTVYKDDGSIAISGTAHALIPKHLRR